LPVEYVEVLFNDPDGVNGNITDITELDIYFRMPVDFKFIPMTIF